MNHELRIKKFFSVFFVFLFLFIIHNSTFIIHSVSAQEITPSSIPLATSSATSSPTSNLQPPTTISPTSPLYTDLLIHNMFHTFSCLMSGISIINQPCLTYQVTRDAQGALKSIPVLSQTNLSGGALGATGSLIGALYVNRPIKTSDYIATIGEDLGIKTVNAQVVGAGADILSPIIRLWQVSRNVSYVLMILIFVIIGLMVMFRQRINPQTVITAQSAIPGLVIGLILITFSFFLAALITDMAFIGTNIVGYYFSAASGNIQTNFVGDLAQSPTGKPEDTHNVLTISGKFMDEIKQTELTQVVKVFFNSVSDSVKNWIRFVSFWITFNTVGGSFGSFPGIASVIGVGLALTAGTFAAAFPPEVFGWVVWFIAIATLIYNMVKLFLRLAHNYLNIIFLTITGPFRFLAASLPGRQDLATDWILDLLCNVLAFPAVAAVFYFVAFILGYNQLPFHVPTPAAGTTNLIGGNTFPLFGGLDLSFLKVILAFSALLAAPAVPEIVCRMLGRVSIAGQLIGQEAGVQMSEGRRYYGIGFGHFGGGVGSLGRAGGAFVGSRSYERDYDKNVWIRKDPSLWGRIVQRKPTEWIPGPTPSKKTTV